MSVEVMNFSKFSKMIIFRNFHAEAYKDQVALSLIDNFLSGGNGISDRMASYDEKPQDVFDQWRGFTMKVAIPNAEIIPRPKLSFWGALNNRGEYPYHCSFGKIVGSKGEITIIVNDISQNSSLGDAGIMCTDFAIEISSKDWHDEESSELIKNATEGARIHFQSCKHMIEVYRAENPRPPSIIERVRSTFA